MVHAFEVECNVGGLDRPPPWPRADMCTIARIEKFGVARPESTRVASPASWSSIFKVFFFLFYGCRDRDAGRVGVAQWRCA